MTVVAHREGSNQQLALKLLPVLSGEQDQQCLMQMREFAKLRDPGIVRIHDFGIEEGYFYVATDLLGGPSVATWLAAHRPALQEVATIIVGVAEALAHMHSHGVYHGDVRPFSILLSEDLAPVLLLPEPTAVRVGAAGAPAYMAPEQLEGQRLEGRSDIYSLGVVLYEMLCERPPFVASTIWERLRRVRDEPPIPPRQLVPAIPAQLEAICLKAMANRVSDRYTTAADLAADLRDWLAAKPVQARRD